MKKLIILACLSALILTACSSGDSSSSADSKEKDASAVSSADMTSEENVRSLLSEKREELHYNRTLVTDEKITVYLDHDADIKAVKQYLKDNGADTDKIKFIVDEPRINT